METRFALFGRKLRIAGRLKNDFDQNSTEWNRRHRNTLFRPGDRSPHLRQIPQKDRFQRKFLTRWPKSPFRISLKRRLAGISIAKGQNTQAAVRPSIFLHPLPCFAPVGVPYANGCGQICLAVANPSCIIPDPLESILTIYLSRHIPSNHFFKFRRFFESYLATFNFN